MPITCKICGKRATLKRPKTGDALCKDCFYWAFEAEIHKTTTDAKLFQRGDRVAIGASGGKDSTVLAYIMKTLNDRHDYGLDLVLLSVDEGITGYRDDSLETVKRNQVQYDLPLKIVSYEELYGWTMDAIVKEVGLKNNCTFCGVFRRQALDRGALLTKCNKIVTGHNADDVAETVIMNVLRGDIARLRRCTAITTGTDGALPRCKPFKYTYEKEIVMYAYFKKLDYFSTECIYSPNAYRGYARAYIKDAEKIRPSSIIDIIHSGESMCIKKDTKMPVQGNCGRCGYISSQALCKACVMLEGLNKGLPKLGIGKSHRMRKQAKELSDNTESHVHDATTCVDVTCLCHLSKTQATLHNGNNTNTQSNAAMYTETRVITSTQIKDINDKIAETKLTGQANTGRVSKHDSADGILVDNELSHCSNVSGCNNGSYNNPSEVKQKYDF